MSTQIQRSWSCCGGTFSALYKPVQGNHKLDQFVFDQAGSTTKIALSKIWINGIPALYLKGFKTLVLENEGLRVATSNGIYDITTESLPFKTVHLIVKTQEGELQLDVPEKLKIVGLKHIIARKLNLENAVFLNLKYQGYALDGSNILEESAIETGSELVLQLSKAHEEKKSEDEKITNDNLEIGGGFSPLPFVIPDTTKTIGFSKTAPSWRAVIRGLNLKGECTNKTCKAFNQIVYIQKGMGTFNMAEECCEATCPECKEAFTKEVKNCGFWDCTYSIIGTMADGVRFKEEKKVAPKDTFLTFEEVANRVSKIAKWKFLKIIVEPTQ